MVGIQAAVCLIVAVTGILSGCATVVNLKEGYSFELKPSGGSSPPKTVYGGVIRDVTSIQDALKMESDNPFHEIVFKAVAVPIFAADIPLSAIADTLTLPITASTAGERVE
jgi:uncharacterized protein YceK